MRRVTGIVAGAALAAAGLGVAGCAHAGSAAGTGNSNPSATSPTSTTATGTASDGRAVAAAYQKTVSAGSAKIATSTQVGVGQQSMPLTASGVIDFADHGADLTENLPGGQGTGETRFLGGVLYERLPSPLVTQISHGKPWISLDVGALSQQGNGSVRQLITDSPADPSAVLAYLRGAGDQVNVIGPDTVDGTPTTHYTVLINLDKAAAGQSTAAQNAVHTLEQQLGSHTLPAQVWIDDQGRLRKFAINTTMSGAAPGASTTPTSGPHGTITFQFTA
ncbi:MAG TPA: hypothetical protein VGD84_06060, partial [Pseudonocardiaceae bacterium]